METGQRAACGLPADRLLPTVAWLRVLRGFYEGLEVPVDRDWLIIGRGRGADLRLAEPTVSRVHAAIGFDGRAFFVEDLGSKNGTRRNGEVCGRKLLCDGDQIQIGALQLQVRIPDPAAERGARGSG